MKSKLLGSTVKMTIYDELFESLGFLPTKFQFDEFVQKIPDDEILRRQRENAKRESRERGMKNPAWGQF